MRSTTYTPEFRVEAVKLVLAQGLTLEEVAQRIAIPKGTLANWVSVAKRRSDPAAPPGSLSAASKSASSKPQPVRSIPSRLRRSVESAQYCADGYRKLVAQCGIQSSMSCKGNCYDNVPMESFWGSLKNEIIHH